MEKLKENRLATVGGICESRFAPLRELFAARLESGDELGASLVVNLDGEVVADLWGGWADEARTRPWSADTIAPVFSTTKAMTALAALVLVDRGELDLDANVAHYWPEFAANGKAEIKVRHLLAHTSGLSGWEQPVALEDLFDQERSTARLAAQAPWWTPGTASGYHALTYGHLIGEVIRRITGRSLGEFFAEQVARPLGADFHIGVPPTELHRIAELATTDWPATDLTRLEPGSVAYKTATGPSGDANITLCRTERWRRADIGAFTGHGNARSVARIQSVVALGGTVAGVRLLRPETVDRIFEVQSDGIDLVVGCRFKIGIGYGLPWAEVLPFVPAGRVCFGAGAGGSLVIADADRRLTFAYVMNRMSPSLIVSPITRALVEQLYAVV